MESHSTHWHAWEPTRENRKRRIARLRKVTGGRVYAARQAIREVAEHQETVWVTCVQCDWRSKPYVFTQRKWMQERRQRMHELIALTADHEMPQVRCHDSKESASQETQGRT